ncbi:MAG TPA: hypothetical protein VJ385_19080 [Fibrobacteria bacterium]|nr:hypothetical protein [Fibrobacteria bacterium]
MMQTESQNTLRAWIRTRPLAIGVLESLAGHRFWECLDLPLERACAELKIDGSRLQERLAALPTPSASRDWGAAPVHQLVDFLTANHRDFRNRDLPRIARLFELIRLEFPAAPAAIDGLASEFARFRQELAWHMDEEEEFLFPKILRTEAGLHHPELYPEIFKGSVSMFPRILWHAPEDAFRDILAHLNSEFKRLINGLHQLPVVREILSVLNEFEGRLKTHAYLETEVLASRAEAMEAESARRCAKRGQEIP